MEKFIKAAASKLHDGKLEQSGGKEISLAFKGMVHILGPESKEKAVIFTALFLKSCAGCSCAPEDLVSCFGCSQPNILEYVSALKLLVKKG